MFPLQLQTKYLSILQEIIDPECLHNCMPLKSTGNKNQT